MHSEIMSCHLIVLYLLTYMFTSNMFVNLNKTEILLKERLKMENKLKLLF